MVTSKEIPTQRLIVMVENYWDHMETARKHGYPVAMVEEARTSMEAAVLAYARPIVAEECAQIVEQSDVASDGPVAKIFNNRLGIIADAIREHGKENK